MEKAVLRVPKYQEDTMNLNQMVYASLASSLVLATGCDKGGSNFSILSTTSQFKHEVTYEPRKLDVLFVVDNSGSMSTSQTNLANNFPSFINTFKSKGYDFKIALATVSIVLLVDSLYQ